MDSPKILQWEQFCPRARSAFELVNARPWWRLWCGMADRPRHAAGIRPRASGVKDGEKVVGLIHIGPARPTPPDRLRPDIAAKTTFLRMILRAFSILRRPLRPRIPGVGRWGRLTLLLFAALQTGAFWAIRNLAPETLSRLVYAVPGAGLVPEPASSCFR